MCKMIIDFDAATRYAVLEISTGEIVAECMGEGSAEFVANNWYGPGFEVALIGDAPAEPIAPLTPAEALIARKFEAPATLAERWYNVIADFAVKHGSYLAFDVPATAPDMLFVRFLVKVGKATRYHAIIRIDGNAPATARPRFEYYDGTNVGVGFSIVAAEVGYRFKNPGDGSYR